MVQRRLYIERNHHKFFEFKALTNQRGVRLLTLICALVMCFGLLSKAEADPKSGLSSLRLIRLELAEDSEGKLGTATLATTKRILTARGWEFYKAGGASDKLVWMAQIKVSKTGRTFELFVRWIRPIDGQVSAEVKRVTVFRELLALNLAKLLQETIEPFGLVTRLPAEEAKIQFDGYSKTDTKPGQIFRMWRVADKQQRGIALRYSFLRQEGMLEADVLCSLHSPRFGTSGSKSVREFASPIKASTKEPIVLKFVSREENTPLVGYQVFYLKDRHDSTTAEFMGVSDNSGLVKIKLKKPKIHFIQIRFNELALVTTPVVPARLTESGVIEFKLKRRPDLSNYQGQIQRILNEFEDLMLLRAAVIKEIEERANAQDFAGAQKLLIKFNKQAKNVDDFQRRLQSVLVSAGDKAKHLRRSVERAKKYLNKERQRLNTDLVLRQLKTLEDRVGAQTKARNLIKASDTALADGEIERAIKLLEQAYEADPHWKATRARLDKLKAYWKPVNKEHADARSVVPGIARLTDKTLRPELKKIAAAIDVFKKHNDVISIQRTNNALKEQLARINLRQREMLRRRDKKRSTFYADLSLAVAPLLDECSSYLYNHKR